MRRYPTYRDSGLAWLGETPAHWRTAKLKHFARVVLGKMLQSEPHAGDVLRPYLRAANVQWQRPDLSDVKQMWFSQDEMATCRLRRSDILVSEGGEVGRACLWDDELDECYIQNSVHKVSCIGDTKPRFVLHQFYAMGCAGFLESIVNRVSIAHLTREKLVDVAFVLPPRDEQDAIVAFLDRTLAEIDRFIANKERLIALLREQKVAIINRAVTRGLDPDMPMKPSGIAWLGDVPSHWKVKRAKYLMTRMEQGWSPQCEARTKNWDEWGVLKVGCVNGYTFDEREHKALPSNLRPIVEYEIRQGDVLISRANTRALVGSAAYVERVTPRLLLCDKLYRVTLRPEAVAPHYFVNLLSSSPSRAQIELGASGASDSMQNISQDVIRNIWVPLPTPAEQEAILEAIERETTVLSGAIMRAEREIELIKEYRTTLISDAVTGKIDVRAAVPAAERLAEEVPV